MRYVTTVDDLLDLIDEAVSGLLRQPPNHEALQERAVMVANVVDFESDDILGTLISLGHSPDVCNHNGPQIVELALHRALAMRYFGADEAVASVLST